MATPRDSSARTFRSYSPGRMVAVAAALIIALGAAMAGLLVASYQDALREQLGNLRNVSIAFSAQTQSVAQAIDQAMNQAERAYLRNATRIDYFDDERTSLDYIIGLYVYNRAGLLVTGATRFDPDRVRVPPPAPALGRPGQLSVTISDVNPATGRGIINFARPITDQQGRRIGTLLAQADSERFERIYNLLELGQGGSVTLFHRDGTMLVRGPAYPAGIGRSFKDTPLFQRFLPVTTRGTIDVVSPLDGVRRLYGFDVVADYPLVIITGVDKRDAMSVWYGRLWTALSLFLLVAASLGYLAWRVARDSARKIALIGELERSETRAERSAQYLSGILNAVGTPIWVLDRALKLVTMNDAFRRFVGRPEDQLEGMPERALLDTATAADREKRYRAVLAGAGTTEATAEIRDGSGAQRTAVQLTSPLAGGGAEPQIVNVLTDITERKKAEEHLAYLANFDVLTGLPNQSQFRRILDDELAKAREQQACLGTLVVSLERAHEVTDLMGHAAGDTALRQLGEVFRSLLPRAAAVARIKSAEFALVVDAEDGRGGIAAFASDLYKRLSEPITLEERDFYLGPVIGVSVFPDDGETGEELYRRAESARNRGRDESVEGVHYFSTSSHTDLDERLTVEAQLRRALERNELRVVYQPKVSISTGRIVGFEALLRWTNQALGEVSPARFVPIAERTGLIIPIGAWALEETCRNVQHWLKDDAMLVKVAVNLSPRQFRQQDLLPSIRRVVQRYGIRLGCLELEITETALISREKEVDALMRDIRALGVELSIDDFGTGYSSLAYLKRFPVQRLKIDATFIRDLEFDGDSAAIANTIVSLARGLKLAVVAEGVESEKQLDILRKMECDEYQGFLFSAPVEASEVVRVMRQNSSPQAVHASG